MCRVVVVSSLLSTILVVTVLAHFELLAAGANLLPSLAATGTRGPLRKVSLQALKNLLDCINFA